jgi:curli production assembly/transport component CsgG
MKTTILSLAVVLGLSGCASITYIPEPEQPQAITTPASKEFNTLPPPVNGPVVAAVYGFTDKTGQRKPSERMANISFAVTQGAEVWVIKALQEIGGGQWFKVVERVGLDNLTKERQIIRQARESVGDTRQLKPMMFAGIIVEGGIIGYDSNTLTGGAGARYLGIGASTQYRQDVVTVTMRAISVQTGEVLTSVSTTKTIISTGSSFTVFKFFDTGTRSLETEVGNSVNEPVNYAVRAAIEQAVVELVKDGDRKGLWAFRQQAVIQPQPVVIPPTPVAAPKEEVKPVPEVVKETPKVVKEEPKIEESKKKDSVTETPVKPAAKKTGRIVDWVNIRETQYGPIKTLIKLQPGIDVEVIELESWWAKVRFSNKEGWIPIQYIKVQQ